MISSRCYSSRHRGVQPFILQTSRPLSHQVARRTKAINLGSFRLIRHVSTSTSPLPCLRSAFYGSALVVSSGFLYLYVTDTRASVHTWLVVPILRMLYSDAEESHHAANSALKVLWQLGLCPRERSNPDATKDLGIHVFGYDLANPIATSAGLDKDADISDALFAIGPSIVEVGGVTPIAQDGNPKPRVFRLPSQNALINRYGLNSEGADQIVRRLRHRVREFAKSKGLGHSAQAERYVLDGHAGVPPGSLTPGRLLAVNIAKNKHIPDHDVDRVKQDYVSCVERLGTYADIIVVNVSSPNTPGLRSLQQSKPLTQILCGVVDAAQNVDRKKKPAVMVKISPDEDSDEEIAGVCQAVQDSGVDGVIVGNTTKGRPDALRAGYKLSPAEKHIMMEQGGYSGPQLFTQTVSLVQKYRKVLDSRPQQAVSSEYGKLSQPNKEVFQTPSPVELPSNVDRVRASVSSGKIDFQDTADLPLPHRQPLFQIPTEEKYQGGSKKADSALFASTTADPRADEPKVIFASGGITNGRQALEVLNAGASIAMVYTALVYGGIGTISCIKDEMRSEIYKGGFGAGRD